MNLRLEDVLSPADIDEVERMGNRQITAARAKRRLPPMRPEFRAQSAEETVEEAVAADYRWLEASNAVLERSLRDLGQQHVALLSVMWWLVATKFRPVNASPIRPTISPRGDEWMARAREQKGTWTESRTNWTVKYRRYFADGSWRWETESLGIDPYMRVVFERWVDSATELPPEGGASRRRTG